MSGVTTEAALTVVRVGLLGLGSVGQAVARGATASSDRLAEAGLLVKCVAALVRDADKPRVSPDIPLVTDGAAFPFERCDVIVEALGGVEPAHALVTQALSRGIPVVTANKSLIAAHGPALQRLAATHGTSLHFEAAVLAGVPCVHTLARRPLASGSGAFAGILNGTSHYLLSRLAEGEPFAEALQEAVTRGYAEPASDNDINGRDAAEKLTILLHLSGCRDVSVHDLPRRSIDDLEPWHIACADRLNAQIKPVAAATLAGPARGAWVGPALVHNTHSFARVRGVTNILTVGTGPDAVTFTGPGAGPDVTAASVLDDVVEVVDGRQSVRRAPVSRVAADVLRHPPAGKWFITVDWGPDADDGTRASDLVQFLAAHNVPAIGIVGERRRFGAVTAPATAAAVRGVADALAAAGAQTVWLPVFEEVTRG